MRLLHPVTLRTVSLSCMDADFEKSTLSRRTVISHAWSEVLKYLVTRQKHPKMWVSDFKLGKYLQIVKYYGDIVGCNLNDNLLEKYTEVNDSYLQQPITSDYTRNDVIEYSNATGEYLGFDDNYLFSDCTTMYFKGLNIFQYVYGNDWRRLVPIENLDEIYRVVGKAIDKRRVK